MLQNAIFVITLSLASAIAASGVHVEDMSPSTFGIEYKGMLAGQTITGAEVPSLFRAHYLMGKYAPLPYLLVSAGAGGTKYSTAQYDSTRFTGAAGASAAVGIHGYTPRLGRFLMITAGSNACLLNSAQDDYHYTAAVIEPIAGIIFLLGNLVDLAAGAKGHIIYGQMEGPPAKNPLTFSNNNRIRGFLSTTLHAPGSGAYAALSLDLSPRASGDWSDGPGEASLSLQVGTLITPYKDADEKSIDSFGDYDKMKRQQEKMAKDVKKE